MGISGKSYKKTARNSLAVGQIIGTVSDKDEQNVTVKHLSALLSDGELAAHPTNESS